VRKTWFAASAMACLVAGCAGTNSPGPGASGAYAQAKPQPAGLSQKMLAPFGLAPPDSMKMQQAAIADAKAKEAQRQALDPLALDRSTGPPTPGLYISMAELSARGGNIPQARQLYQKALAADPKHLDALLGAARMEDREGHMDVAVMLYQRAADAYPKNPTVLNDLGLCLARQGKLPEAERALARAVQLDPAKALYRNNIAKVEIELNRIDVAVSHMAAVYTPPVVNYNMGVLLFQRGRNAEAERFLNAAIAADGRMEPARMVLAQIHPQAPVYQTARVSAPVQIAPASRQVVVEEPVTPTPESPQMIDTGAPAMPGTESTPTLLPPVM
jgi:Tfp pilus assembly protein PilF